MIMQFGYIFGKKYLVFFMFSHVKWFILLTSTVTLVESLKSDKTELTCGDSFGKLVQVDVEHLVSSTVLSLMS